MLEAIGGEDGQVSGGFHMATTESTRCPDGYIDDGHTVAASLLC
ncbi:hypothetical protein BJB45_03485 [Halomonas huangheensis]|uniref:Uncharacterized protein n=1 Tax=Halomonas huangheensis TaxID=1178482 RepID=W1N3R2_9GAMM|nr:hypothetical protein BJB45_03485 [Halomonas huangheensis]